MNFKNTVTLTALALLTGYLDASKIKVLQATNKDAITEVDQAAVDFEDEAKTITQMKAGKIPLEGEFSTLEAFNKIEAAKKQGLFEAGDEKFYYAFGRLIDQYSGAFWSLNLDDDEILKKIGAAHDTLKGHHAPVNVPMAKILSYVDPNRFPLAEPTFLALFKLMSDQAFSHVLPIHRINSLKEDKLKSFSELWATYISKHNLAGKVQKHVLKPLLGDAASAILFEASDIKNMMKDEELSKLLDADTVAKLEASKVGAGLYGRLLKNLRADAFSKYEGTLQERDYAHLSAKQVAEYQSKLPSGKPVTFVPSKFNPVFVDKISKSTWENWMTNVAKTDQESDKWRFWKRIPLDVFKMMLEHTNYDKVFVTSNKLPTIIDKLTKDQRQVLLDGKTKIKCEVLTEKIFTSPRPKNTAGLTASEECFSSRVKATDKTASAKMILEGCSKGAFSSSLMKNLPKDVVSAMEAKVPRPPKTGKDGKPKVYRDDDKNVEFRGILAFEKLKLMPNNTGAEYVKSYQSDEHSTDVKSVCKEIDVNKLRKAKWLQPLLEKDCVRAISLGSSIRKDIKKLSPSIWKLVSKSQLKQLGIEKHDSDVRDLDGPFMEGLTANKGFAKIATSVHEEDDKDSKEEGKRKKLCLLDKFSDDILRQYFSHDFVINVPKDKDQQELLAKYIAKFSDDALAGANAEWIKNHKDVFEAARPEQRARASDAVDAAASLPATYVSATSVPEEIIKSMSATFMSRLNDSVLSGFTKEQVEKIPAEAFCLLCGDKQKALKVELSAEQKANLGKNCPVAAEAEKKDSMAPSNAHVGAFAAVVAAAAGSLALFL